MVALSRKNAAAAGVTNLATFTNGDIFQTDFTKATVVTMFLLPSLNVRLRPQLLKMRPGTRIVSNSFDMGDWTPDQEAGAEHGQRFQEGGGAAFTRKEVLRQERGQRAVDEEVVPLEDRAQGRGGDDEPVTLAERFR